MYKLSFVYVLLHIYPSLKADNIKFGYQNRNSKKHGHFKKKTNRQTLEVTYELKIERNDNDAAKIYTLLHEYTHYLNNHLDSKTLTFAQKEVVADQVALHFINQFSLMIDLKKSNLNKKWDVEEYSKNWSTNRRINNKQKMEIHNQIGYSIEVISNLLIINNIPNN